MCKKHGGKTSLLHKMMDSAAASYLLVHLDVEPVRHFIVLNKKTKQHNTTTTKGQSNTSSLFRSVQIPKKTHVRLTMT